MAKMTAKEIICFADKEAREKGLSQMQWGKEAGLDPYGKTISRAYFKSDCKLSVCIKMLNSLGYELVVQKGDEIIIDIGSQAAAGHQ